MFIEEPEAFKAWLTTILKPMCDADPAALAKYIIALVKKDKSTSALRESMINQLEVFLQGETGSFVNLLFKTLETQEYLTPIIPSTNPPNPNVDIDTSMRSPSANIAPKEQSKSTLLIPASELPNLIDGINNGTRKDNRERDREDPVGAKKDYKKPDTERDEKLLTSSTSSLTSVSLPTSRRRSRHRSLSRERIRNTSRSRSRSWDRSRRPNSRSPPSQQPSNIVEQTAPTICTTGNKAPTSSSYHHHHSSTSISRGGGDKVGGSDKPGGLEHRRGSDRSGNVGAGGRSGVWRNKSPPSRRYGGNRGDRRGGSQSPLGRDGTRKSRSRSPARHGAYRSNRYRNRSPPPHQPLPHRSPRQSRSRSRSRDRPLPPTIAPPSMNVAAVLAAGGTTTPTQDSSHGDMDMRLGNVAQSIQSVVVAATVASGGGVAPPGTTGGPIIGKRRCRDYDEKGYCMRGEMCPYDHGIDPVVVEDTTLSQVLAYTSSNAAAPQQANGPVVRLPPLDGPPPLVGLHPHHGLGRLPPGGGAPPPPPEYNPQAPHMWRGPPQMIGGPPLLGQMGIGYGPPPCPPGALPPNPPNQPPPPAHPLHQRELVSIPTTMNHHKHHLTIGQQTLPPPSHLLPGGLNHQHGINDPPPMNHYSHHPHHHGGRHPYMGGMFKQRKTFDYNRLGPRRGGLGGGILGGGIAGLNCALELKKVPVGMNNITHLNNHFGKFGKIINIQVSYEGDPEAAIVTFSSHAEANVAYRSTEAVLNNRFIKVFWHSPEGTSGNKSQGQTNDSQSSTSNRAIVATIPSVKDRLGTTANNPQQHHTNKVLNLANSTSKSLCSQTQTLGKSIIPPGGGLPSTSSIVAASVAEKENNLQSEDAKAKSELVNTQKEQQAVAVAAIKKGQELLAAKEKLKKNQEEKRREAIKLTQDLRKRKQELLEKQLAQQKLLIDKMEKTSAGVQRDKLLETIKKSQESIEAIRKDMLSQPTVTAVPKPVTAIQIAKSKEEVQKEMLDAELDLITKQQEGVDTTEVQRRLKDLQARQRQLLSMKSGFPKVAKRYNPLQVNRTLLSKNNLIGDGNNLLKGNLKSINAKSVSNNHLQHQQKHAVDHRPTRILVSGYENDEIDGVLTYFAQFGEIADHHSDASTPHVILNYRSRKEAEQALLRGKHFQDRTLSVTWCLIPPPTIANNKEQHTKVASITHVTSVILPTLATLSANAQAASASSSAHACIKKPRLSANSRERTVLLSTGSDADVDDLLLETSSMLDEGVLLDGLDEDRILLEGKGKRKGGKIGGVLDGDDELGVEISEEVLLQDDEEEDEENEDRSWRR